MRKISKIEIFTIGLCIFLVSVVSAGISTQPPVAIDDTYSVDEGETLNVAAAGVLGNDYDNESDPLTAILDAGPNYASSFILNSDGSFSYTHDGSETTSDSFTYHANDGSDDSNIATVTITINQIEEPPEEPPTSTVSSRAGKSSSRIRNLPPIADASAGEPYHGYINEEIIFDGSLSHDPDGTIVSYHWNFDDVIFGNGEIVNNTYSSPKTSLVTLTVMDDKGAKDTYITTISISQPNRPPSDPDIYGPETCIMGTKYSYAALSRDSDGDNLKYVFDWGDNNTDESEFLSLEQSHGVSFIHNWSYAGNYTIIVTVSDNQTVSSSEISVVVIEPSYNYSTIIILGVIIVFFIILSLILVKRGEKSKLRKK
jgi:hypothetical protein